PPLPGSTRWRGDAVEWQCGCDGGVLPGGRDDAAFAMARGGGHFGRAAALTGVGTAARFRGWRAGAVGGTDSAWSIGGHQSDGYSTERPGSHHGAGRWAARAAAAAGAVGDDRRDGPGAGVSGAQPVDHR